MKRWRAFSLIYYLRPLLNLRSSYAEQKVLSTKVVIDGDLVNGKEELLSLFASKISVDLYCAFLSYRQHIVDNHIVEGSITKLEHFDARVGTIPTCLLHCKTYGGDGQEEVIGRVYKSCE